MRTQRMQKTDERRPPIRIWIVMGVSGSGKSTIAKALAKRMGGVFFDADDFHPAENRQKMADGIPLTDDDRRGWLDALNTELKQHNTTVPPVFLACSALRQGYRDRLSRGLERVGFIYLKGTKECIRRRLESRRGHFMPASLLDSQFAILEEPRDAIVVSIEHPACEIVKAILSDSRATSPSGS